MSCPGNTEQPPVAGQQADPYRLENPYTPQAQAKQRKRNKRLAKVFGGVLGVLIVAVAAFLVWDEVRPIDYGAYATQEITIVGLTDDAFTVTPEDLADLECVRMTASGTGQGVGGASKAGIVAAYGPLLETFLDQYGYTQTDFRRIKCYCSDGYTVVLRGETLEYDIVLSIASGKDALYEVQRPLRLVIPDEQSGKWAYGVTRIEFTK